MDRYGFKRIGTAVVPLEIANTQYNEKIIIRTIKKAMDKAVKVLVFPELSITGYTAMDLFLQSFLLKQAENSLGRIVDETKNIDMVVAVGMPVNVDNQLFNTAVIFSKGKILGVVPKTFIPTYGEFQEGRWFTSSINRTSNTIILCKQEVPFNENLLFKDTMSDLCIGVEICEDLWVSVSPSSFHTQYGANVILNLSASNDVVGKSERRRELVKTQSEKCLSAYAYSSASSDESTTDLVFSGHSIIANSGCVISDEKYNDEILINYADIDIQRLISDRQKMNSYMGRLEKKEYQTVKFSLNLMNNNYGDSFIVNKHPFVPEDTKNRDKRCNEILNIQAKGLAQRLKKAGINKAVIGISGGLDSTLALLVVVEVFKQLNLPLNNILGITMPGFGTTKKTYNNAIKLMNGLGISQKEISIEKACLQHFSDIEYDAKNCDVTYENVQARERTQILMDIANKENALVIGTGDLSELALGWCTYNGDHISNYSVNSSIPKTLVKYLVSFYATNKSNEKVKDTLLSVLNTPISPELLPKTSKGEIKQKTEDILGPYELHDFFLYNMIRNSYDPMKIFKLACIAYKEEYSEREIKDTLKIFLKRFFLQQFKRSCLPDGTKVGSVSLSPRCDWRMPSDASYKMWLKELE